MELSDYGSANMIISRAPGRSATLYSAYRRHRLFSISPGFYVSIGQRYIVVNKAEAQTMEGD
jgi:hypothetical protein